MPKWPEHWTKRQGQIEIAAGPMFAGKSDYIIAQAERWARSGVSMFIVKHPLDTRYKGLSEISSHGGRSVKCEAIEEVEEIYHRVEELDPCVVIVDEVQFYINDQERFVAMVKQFAIDGRIVLLSGLDMDFRGEPFGPMAVLMAIADQVTKLTAICSVCGADAAYTQRLIDGEPAPASGQLVVVGAKEAYDARCRGHHEVPGKRTFADLFR